MRPAGGSFRVFEHSNQNVHKQTLAGTHSLLAQHWRANSTKHSKTNDEGHMATTSESAAVTNMEVEPPPSNTPITNETVTAELAKLNLTRPDSYGYDYTTVKGKAHLAITGEASHPLYPFANKYGIFNPTLCLELKAASTNQQLQTFLGDRVKIVEHFSKGDFTKAIV